MSSASSEALRGAILGCDDRPVRFVSVPEWGVQIGVRSLSLRELRALGGGGEGPVTVQPEQWIVALACDSRGTRVFEPGDAAILAEERDAAVLARVGNEMLQALGLGRDAVETAAGNSGAGPSAG
jgi:hypothetical protein